MKLRTKFFLPLILVSVLFGLYAHYVWLPKYTQTLLSNQKKNTQAHIRTAAEGLVPLLLEDRLANVYDNLDALLDSNKKWLAITLARSDGKLLYPLDVPMLPIVSKSVEVYRQVVAFGGPSLANLTLYVDLSPVLKNLSVQTQRFQVALMLFFFVLILVLGIIIELVVRRPIRAISIASNQLSNGVYNANLPRMNSDEIGDLNKNFINMRDAIVDYHSELVGEITKHKATEKKLVEQKEMASFQAAHDNLTGLINRREFEKRVNSLLIGAQKNESHHALLYIDLDQFKVVNDTCGHIAGDNLLCQLAALMQENMRETDTLARLGGDEFAILLKNCDITKAYSFAAELLETVQTFRFSWENKLFRVGASMGLVDLYSNIWDYFSILSAADSACYTAKEKGRNRIQIYQSEDVDLTKQRGDMLWVSRIHKALEKGQFQLYCQPISKISGEGEDDSLHYEVLIRMLDDDGSLIMPNAFIPAAERYNLITVIDRWVIKNVFEFVRDYYQSKNINKKIKLSLNLSGHSLGDKETLTYIEAAYAKYKLPKYSIGFEITETAAIQKLNYAVALITQLKKLGCEFYLDDFGSGLSSFNYLKTLPLDFVKIDGGFVKDIDTNPLEFAMVKSINDIAHVMGKKTIAEFVCNREILEKLREIGVDYAQGDCMGQPFPIDQIYKMNYETSDISMVL